MYKKNEMQNSERYKGKHEEHSQSFEERGWIQPCKTWCFPLVEVQRRGP